MAGMANVGPFIPPSLQNCPFCLHNWDKLDIVDQAHFYDPPWAIIRPLDPVTPGHVLVISGKHAGSAAEDPEQAGKLMTAAARYVAREAIQANIITSIGTFATQTVKHTHIHVVPRTERDLLHLPWTGQKERQIAALEKKGA